MSKLTGNLHQSGLIVNTKQFIRKYSAEKLNKLLVKFKLKTFLFNGNIEYHRTYVRISDKNIIIFPRMEGIKLIKPLLDKFINHIPDGEETKQSEIAIDQRSIKKDNWNVKMNLHHNQIVVANYLMDNVFTPQNCKEGISSTILNMKAGQGKSYVAMWLISLLKVKTLIIVHNSVALEQWTTLLKETFEVNIGCYWTDKKKDGHIMVIICNSVLSDKFKFGKNITTPKNFFQQFGFVIYDEVHKYCSKKMSKIFNKAQSKYVLGMSATTNNRQDKLDPISHQHIGMPLQASMLKDYRATDIEFKMAITMIKYKGPEKYTETITSDKTNSVSAPKMINQICEDPYRKILLCNKLEELYREGTNTFIFADRRKYLVELATALYKRLCPEENEAVKIKIEDTDLSVLLGGEKDRKTIRNAKNKSLMIFSTYPYMDTGISINRMTAFVIATPRRNGWEQKIGRILRLGSDISIVRKVIILCDYNTAIKTQTMHAKNQIKKLFNATITQTTICYEDIVI